MSAMQIDRLLDTIVKNGASDLHISTGRPPTIRLHGKLKSLATKVIDAEDATALMKSITPEKNQAELAECGGTDFGFAFGDAARFRASVFRQRGDISMVLRLIPNKLLTFDEIGLPKIVTGRNYITAQNRAIPCIVIAFASDLGRFCLEVSLKKSF